MKYLVPFEKNNKDEGGFSLGCVDKLKIWRWQALNYSDVTFSESDWHLPYDPPDLTPAAHWLVDGGDGGLGPEW